MKYPRELIKEIIAKIDLVEYIKQYVELKQRGKDYFGICPFHEDSDPSFSVSPEKNIWYCFGCGTGSTIIDFVMKYHKVKFPKAVEMLLDYLKLDVNNIKEEANIISFLKQFTYKKDLTQVEHEILPPDIMSKYIKKPIKEWLDEGIKQEVMDKYQVRYDKNANRAVFPIYDRYGNIINIKGRTLYPNYKDLGIPKYIYYYPLGCNDFLYGLSFKEDKIKELNEVIIVEGSKSVWKLEGWGVENVLSLETNRINEYQLRLLLELKCNVTVALDKGVLMKQIKKDFSKLCKFTNVYVMYDTEGLLEDKDAPCDKGKEVWDRLYSNKIKLR